MTATAAAFVGRHPLAVFFFLAFALTWLVEIPMLASPRLAPLQLVVGWMPGLAAIFVAGAAGGRAGVRDLLRRLLHWRVGAGWYLVALLGPLVLFALPAALNPLFGGSGLRLPPLSAGLLAGAALQLGVRMVLSSEQLAWSGFVLPRLQARHGALGASLVLGAIWAVWHLPLFFVPGSQRDLGFPGFLLATVALRVVLTWVFNSTGGSVLLVSLMHQATNVVTDLMGPFAAPADQALNARLGGALLLGVATVLVLVTGPARLTRTLATGRLVVERVCSRADRGEAPGRGRQLRQRQGSRSTDSPGLAPDDRAIRVAGAVRLPYELARSDRFKRIKR